MSQSNPGNLEYIYRIDYGDIITFVDEAWLQFAEKNDAPQLSRDAVVGRPIWDFIRGKDTRQMYRLLLKASRERNIQLDIPFRCDAPGKRRFMRLLIAPDSDKNLLLTSILIREEERDDVELPAPKADAPEVHIRMCSWCKRVTLPEGRWIELEEAVTALRVFETETHPKITHGICPDCRNTMLEQWELEKA